MEDELIETREALFLLCAAGYARVQARAAWAEKEAALFKQLETLTVDVADILEAGDEDKTWNRLRGLSLAVFAYMKARAAWAEEEQPLDSNETDTWLRANSLLNRVAES